MKVLITGSSGALGRILTNYLISNSIAVAGIDIQESTEHYPDEYFRFHYCSVTDKERLKSIFNEEQPTNVVHFACSFNKIRDKAREHEVDIGGAENVLEATDNTLSVKQLIFSSSAAAYGGNSDNKIWLKESDPLRPGKYRYGLNKKIIEKSYHHASVRDNLQIISLRICTVVGPTFSKPRSVVSLIIKFPFLPGCCADNKIQFLHSDDMVSLFELILDDKVINGVFNLAPDSYAVVRELVPGKKFRSVPLSLITGFMWVLWNLKILNLQPAAVSNAVYPIIIDPSKIVSRYGYKFKFSAQKAFTDTIHNNQIPLNSKL